MERNSRVREDTNDQLPTTKSGRSTLYLLLLLKNLKNLIYPSFLARLRGRDSEVSGLAAAESASPDRIMCLAEFQLNRSRNMFVSSHRATEDWKAHTMATLIRCPVKMNLLERERE